MRRIHGRDTRGSVANGGSQQFSERHGRSCDNQQAEQDAHETSPPAPARDGAFGRRRPASLSRCAGRRGLIPERQCFGAVIHVPRVSAPRRRTRTVREPSGNSRTLHPCPNRPRGLRSETRAWPGRRNCAPRVRWALWLSRRFSATSLRGAYPDAPAHRILPCRRRRTPACRRSRACSRRNSRPCPAAAEEVRTSTCPS